MTINFTDQIRAAKEAKTLNKPFRTPGGPKKFSVYTKNEKGNVVKVNFGDPNMKIKRSDPARRKSFRARHGCDKAPGPKWKAKYWSCQQWRAGAPVQGSENTTVSLEAEAGKGLWYNIQKKKERMGKNYKPAKPGDKDYPDPKALKKAQAEEWDGITFWDQVELLKICPELAKAEEVEMESEEQEFEEYKSDFLGMSIGSLRSIQNHVNAILANLENPSVKENLTESWLQGKIAVTEDYMTTIHNYVMFNQEDDTKAKLFQPSLELNKHNTQIVDQAYKTIVEPSLEKEHGKREGAFTEDDMEYQMEYKKTIHPDYKVEHKITKDKIFTPQELNKDLKPYPGSSKR